MVNIKLNGIEVVANAEETILDVAKRYEIKIPTLCHLHLHEFEFENKPASCRVCMVENVTTGKLIPSCVTKVQEGMDIRTDSIKAIKSRRNVVELLLSNHPPKCLTCAKSTQCELQQMAFDLGIREIEFEGERIEFDIDNNNLSIVRDPNKCILCNRCVSVCSNIQTVNALSMVDRGFSSRVGSAYDLPMNNTTCTFCGQCLAVCPTGALTEINSTKDVWRHLYNNEHIIIQTAPAVRVALGEEFGFEPGTDVTGKMVTALKMLGFKGVYDTNFAADLTILEEANEFLTRFKNGGPFPIITSCCPAWIRFMEGQFSEFINLPSSAKSPHEMFGAIAKTYLAQKLNIEPEKMRTVSVMPCVAKKYEAARTELGQEGSQNVDYVITTRELALMIKEAGIDFRNLEDSDFEDPLGESTGAGSIFGATGGVLEATLRSAYLTLTGDKMKLIEFKEVRGFKGIKMSTVEIGGVKLNIAVTNGLKNIRKLLTAIKNKKLDLHVVEVMACPGGCIGGAGQPYHRGDTSVLVKRSKGIYAIDKSKEVRISQLNTKVQQLYKDFLGEVGGKKAHELLHTSYKADPKF